MIKYYQLTNDDCFRTCLACILEKEPVSVPHFFKPEFMNKKYNRDKLNAAITKWLHKNGYNIFHIDTDSIQQINNNILEYCICIVKYNNTKNNIIEKRHAIVGKIDKKEKMVKLVHCPVLGNQFNHDGIDCILGFEKFSKGKR